MTCRSSAPSSRPTMGIRARTSNRRSRRQRTRIPTPRRTSSSASPVGAGSGANCTDTDGVVQRNGLVECDVQNLKSDVYEIAADIQGNWFDGTGLGSLAVFDPANGFATGGGHFAWGDAPSGPFEYPDPEVNYGFTGKKLKKNVNGSVLLVIHTEEGPYVVKTNAFTGLANNQVPGHPDWWYTSMT